MVPETPTPCNMRKLEGVSSSEGVHGLQGLRVYELEA